MANTPDLNQIAIVMSRLQHNYSQLAQKWFDIFYNPTPMDDIEVTFFTEELINSRDESTTPQLFTLKNRASDFQCIKNGEGDPEDSVSGKKGYIYQDLQNGKVYIKTQEDQTSSGGTDGWAEIADQNKVDALITKRGGSPEGAVSASMGTLYVDTTAGVLYIKTTATGNTGWQNVIAGDDVATETLINQKIAEVLGDDLSNLTTTAKTLVPAINELNSKSSLPDQEGNAGYYLTTDGETASWTSRGTYEPPLLTAKWFDYKVTQQCWLRADLFAWQSNSLYPLAYEHLVRDIVGISSTTETVSGITITFYQATDGHKIVMPSQATNVYSIYAISGHANYYILDTVNGRFKLPCEKHGDVVESYSQEGDWYRVYADGWCEQGGKIPSGTSSGTINLKKTYTDTNFSVLGTQTTTSAVSLVPATTNTITYGKSSSYVLYWQSAGYIDSSEYSSQNTLSRFLYFYVGQFAPLVQEQQQDIEEIKETLNEKVDISDMMSVIPVVEEGWDSVNKKGYRVWASGYCEQWGIIGSATPSTSTQTINFTKTFANTDFSFFSNILGTASTDMDARYNIEVYASRSTASVTMAYTASRSWKACGYIVV